jgi:hypothetical protein
LTVPLLATAVGVDGSSMFQILATENLQLSPEMIGLAFGLGVVSIPFQLMAARIPLWRARRNLQIFLMVMVSLTVALAVLVAAEATGAPAALALAITVVAEIAVSVLYATSFQPLVAYGLDSTQRQRLGRIGRPLGSLIVATTVLVFAAVGPSWRAAMMMAMAAAGVWTVTQLRHVSAPPRPADPEDRDGADGGRIPPEMRRLYVCFALMGFGAWPLLLVYVHVVLWPSGNLGVIAALELAGGLLASVMWRPTTAGLLGRARGGALGVVAAALAVASLGAPVRATAAQAVLLVAVFATAYGLTVMRIALFEMAHRRVDEASSVRAFTVLDVIASSSVQLGLLVGGVLIGWSERSSWPVDPYRIYVVVSVAAAATMVVRLRDVTPSLT